MVTYVCTCQERLYALYERICGSWEFCEHGRGHLRAPSCNGVVVTFIHREPNAIHPSSRCFFSLEYFLPDQGDGRTILRTAEWQLSQTWPCSDEVLVRLPEILEEGTRRCLRWMQPA